jgi:hypothetical protein
MPFTFQILGDEMNTAVEEGIRRGIVQALSSDTQEPYERVSNAIRLGVRDAFLKLMESLPTTYSP